MTDNPNAVATRDQQSGVTAAQDLTVRSVAVRDEVERIEATITLPPEYQYAIPKWNSETRSKEISGIGITADGYEYLNRVVGATFYLPDQVPDRDGNLALNPIVRKDYIRLRMGAVWYNALGQLIGNVEDVETDFNLVWMDARINSRSAEVVMDPNGLPLFDDFGNPAIKLSKEDELKALKSLSQLRTFGIRYAQTVCRVRLLKMAVGIRSLPGNVVKPHPVKVVGFRDRMTPQQRVNRANEDSRALFGLPTEREARLTRSEIADLPGDPDTEHIDRDAIEAAIDPTTPFTAAELAEDLAEAGGA